MPWVIAKKNGRKWVPGWVLTKTEVERLDDDPNNTYVVINTGTHQQVKIGKGRGRKAAGGISYERGAREKYTKGKWLDVDQFSTKAPASDYVRIYKAQGNKARLVKTNYGYKVQLWVTRPYTRAGEARGAAANEDAVRELVLYIQNDGDLYRQMTTPIMKNLAKKMVKGTYNHDLAVKGWGHLANAGAKKYTQEFGGSGNGSYGSFSPADRRSAAVEFAAEFEAEAKANPDYVLKLVGK